MTRAPDPVAAAARAVIAAALFADLNDPIPRVTEADTKTAADAVVRALEADGWQITPKPTRRRTSRRKEDQR